MTRRARGEGTVEQRGPDRWRLRVYVGSARGRPVQASRTIYAKNRTEALKQLRKFAAENDDGKVRAGPRATVAALLDAHLKHLKRVGRSPTTLETYRVIVDTHLIPHLGRKQVRRLSGFDLDEYYAAQADAGLSARYIRTHHALMSSALSQAVRWGWLGANPALAATPPTAPRRRKAIPVPDEVRQLIDAAGSDMMLATAVALAAVTGCRRGELCGLQWPDVDWQAGAVRVCRQRVPLRGGDVTKSLKYDDEDGRLVSVGPLGLAVLERWRQHVTVYAAQLCVKPDWTGWLLSRDCGRTPAPAKALGEQFSALGRRAGVKVTTHAFRRFAATQMVGAGVDIRTAAGRLGHTPGVMLREYAGFLPARDVEAAAGLERLVLEREETPRP